MSLREAIEAMSEYYPTDHPYHDEAMRYLAEAYDGPFARKQRNCRKQLFTNETVALMLGWTPDMTAGMYGSYTAEEQHKRVLKNKAAYRLRCGQTDAADRAMRDDFIKHEIRARLVGGRLSRRDADDIADMYHVKARKIYTLKKEVLDELDG